MCASSTASGTRPAAPTASTWKGTPRSEEHTSELQSQSNLVCRLLLEKKNRSKPEFLAQIDTAHVLVADDFGDVAFRQHSSAFDHIGAIHNNQQLARLETGNQDANIAV